MSKQKKTNNKLSQVQNNESLKNKTLKNPYLHIQLELPDDLKEPLCPSQLRYTEDNNETTSNIMLKLQNKMQDVPYGCLKNGVKPTYRNWQTNTQKNNSNTMLKNSVMMNAEPKQNNL